MGYGKSSNEYYVSDEESTNMVMARSVQRVPFDLRWKADGLESMNVPCQQLYDRHAARAVHAEGFVGDPQAKKHEV